MGLFDDMTVLLSKGMDAADKKTQVLKLQTDLSHIERRKAELLTELGRAVLLGKASDEAFVLEFADQIKPIVDLEQQEASLRSRIEDLQRAEVLTASSTVQSVSSPSVPSINCPVCATSVSIGAMFCPSCGDTLAAAKRQYKRCPQCDVYYAADAVFCERCGTKVVDLPVASAIAESASSPLPHAAAVSEDVSNTPGVELLQPVMSDDAPVHEEASLVLEKIPVSTSARVCPACGAVAKDDAAFCGECGSRL